MQADTEFSSTNRSFGTAISRWASVGPYYAMFPVSFAFDVVRDHSNPGDSVLDPFAGRGSSIYAAAALGRHALGVEINPVGWLYGRIKLRPASQRRVLERLEEVGHMAGFKRTAHEAEDLPRFFTSAYSPKVRRFLVAARKDLAWRSDRVDATLMALILVYLHGKREAALSNQMREGKAMAPDYAIRWWADRDMRPPNIDPVEFLSQRIAWRYRKGRPDLTASIRFGDSVSVLRDVARRVEARDQKRFDLLFTSPPYMGVTNYHYDQWLRLWLLGGTPDATAPGGKWRGKFESREGYKALLSTVFGRSAACMAKDATVYVRTDARPFTLQATKAALRAAFPGKRMRVTKRPLSSPSQTALFGDTSKKPGEVDVVMTT